MNLDPLIIEFDRALRSVFGPAQSVRAVPGSSLPEPELTERQKRHAAALMRVNHCGEICAQALYQGQSLTSRDPLITGTLRQAAQEEAEHLAWTEKRIADLAGKLGDDWNLGFLAETERQVEAHLTDHLAQLPEHDAKSREILDTMRTDEVGHADTAVRLGARDLPGPMRLAMKLASLVMTKTAYWV
jgi:ubiquinone biosynthesis monooxygenase Coq7